MRIPALILAFILGFSALKAQPRLIDSEIKDVTVFTRGAEVQRQAQLTLREGINEFYFAGLPEALDQRSLQFRAKGDFTLISVKYEIKHGLGVDSDSSQHAELNGRLQNLSEQIEAREDRLAVNVKQEKVLLNNSDFKSWDNISVEKLKQGVELVREQLTANRSIQRKLNREIDELNNGRQKALNQLEEMRRRLAKPQGVAVVKLRTAKEQELAATLSYTVADASWEPTYDLRFEALDQPLTIEYKASIRQSTGEDWKDVDLRLSTGDPSKSGSLPELKPWYLNFVSRYRSQPNRTPQKPGVSGEVKGLIYNGYSATAVPGAKVTALDRNNLYVASTVTKSDGGFSLKLDRPAATLRIRAVGFQPVTKGLRKNHYYYLDISKNGNNRLSLEDDDLSNEQGFTKVRSAKTVTQEDIVTMAVRDISTTNGSTLDLAQIEYNAPLIDKISQNPTNLNFEVKMPYDIPSDGEAYKVDMLTYEKEVAYQYHAVPKLNKHAYLSAGLTGWEELQLLDGTAGIYFEGTYLGETEVKPGTAGDTLQLSLGQDQNIVVSREPMRSEVNKKFFSRNVEERFYYQIKVRNNKNTAIRLQIRDQFPVAGNEDISVERLEDTGAKKLPKDGLLQWEFQLEPGDTKKLDIIYLVNYPRNKKVNLY